MHSTPPSVSSLTRRRFIVESTLAASALGLSAGSSIATAQTPAPTRVGRSPVIVFSKPFQTLNAEKTAEFVADVGWDGIECPVRAKGQVEPERAAEVLPLYATALRQRKCDIFVATTDIVRIDQKHAEKTLRTLSSLGIKRIRLGFFKYDLSRSPAAQLPDIQAALKDIAAACGELGIQAGFQNHSGRTYVGAPVWDTYSMIKDMNPREIGFCFDIGHATIEGGLAWPIHAKLAEPFYTAVFVKDFTWKRTEKGWKEAWCPLGEGMVDRAFFDTLKKSSFTGPISQHHEYRWTDDAQMASLMRQDLKVLKSWLA